MSIKGIFFDSGMVLLYPTNKSWFISKDFFNIINKSDFEKIPEGKREEGFKKAQALLSFNENLLVTNQKEEIEVFEKFYEELSKKLPELKITNSDISKLAKSLVEDSQKYSFYNEVEPLLLTLRKTYKLAVVSDAWPSMRDSYSTSSLDKYFETIVISSELGVLKPHKDMYNTALEATNLKPEECIFIDDNPENVIGANNLNILGLCLKRDYNEYIQTKESYPNLKVISNLNEIFDFIE